MAIVENFWLRNSRKRLAGSVIYQAMGQTRQRALATSVTNPRTDAQQTQRVKWANLVNLYRANKDWMKYAFETKQEKQSEYNKFMSLNVSNSRIYLPKMVANAGGCVIDNYIVTQGSLPSIELEVVDDYMKSNIFLSDDFQLITTTLVGEFSRDLLLNNPALREGDQLSFILMAQQTNGTTGFPYVVVRKYEMIIDSNSFELFTNYLPLDYLQAYSGESNKFLGIDATLVNGGYCLILSRTVSGKTYVSTQRIVTYGIDNMISQYSSPAALADAVQSYGESTDAFLSATTAVEDRQAAISASIIAVAINDVQVTIGDVVYPTNFDDDTTIKVTFNQNIAGSEFSARVKVGNGSSQFTLNSSTVTRGNQNELQITLPESAEDYADWALIDVYVTVNGTEYRAPFKIPYELSPGGGLE